MKLRKFIPFQKIHFIFCEIFFFFGISTSHAVRNCTKFPYVYICVEYIGVEAAAKTTIVNSMLSLLLVYPFPLRHCIFSEGESGRVCALCDSFCSDFSNVLMYQWKQ